MRDEAAIRRIESFGKRFGPSRSHLYLAYHAAFPLALTPDLLYRIWANFQRDVDRKLLNIPWIAVADILLSNLCDDVGHELYEMDVAVRNELLKQLKEDSQFGEKLIANAEVEEEQNLLWQQGNTKIYSLCTDEPWTLPFDALVIPVGIQVGFGSFANSLINFLGENSIYLYDSWEGDKGGYKLE